MWLDGVQQVKITTTSTSFRVDTCDMRANQLASILMHYLIDEIFCHMSKIKLQNMSWSFQLSNLINSGFKLDRSQSFSILCLNKSQSQTDSATFNLMIWFDILKTVKSEFPVTRVKISFIWDSIKCCVTANIHFLRTMITDKLLEQRWPGIFYLLMSSILSSLSGKYWF